LHNPRRAGEGHFAVPARARRLDKGAGNRDQGPASAGEPMPPEPRPIAAAFWMTGSIAGFCALAVAGREIAPALDTFEMMLYRSLIGVVIVALYAAATRRWSAVSARRLDLQLWRNLVHFVGQNLWLAALLMIPMAQLFALEFTSPIMVALLAPALLGERLTRMRMLAAGLGFAGILIVTRPFGGAGLSLGLGVALLAAASFAGAAILTKRLTRIVPVLSILFWLTVTQTLFGLICAGWDGAIALPGPRILPWVALMGGAGILAHLCLTKALALAPATIVTPIDFLRLPIIALVGAFFYDEPLDRWVLVGGAVIFAANWLNLRAETRRIGDTVAV
jgi:drug/metabolite transporter (DMT)-like permease